MLTFVNDCFQCQVYPIEKIFIGKPSASLLTNLTVRLPKKAMSHQISGAGQADFLIFKKIWPDGKYFGALNLLFHGRNQACEKYPALVIHKIRSLQWPMSHMYPGR